VPSTLSSSWPGATSTRAAELSSNTSRNIQCGRPESITERIPEVNRSWDSGGDRSGWLKLSVRYYLAAALPGLADLPIQRLPDLTPAAWVAQHSWTQTN
jgi:hypothetical protein